MAMWFDLATPAQIERLELAWLGAPTEQVEVCAMLLDVAREQVVEFAPASAFGVGVTGAPDHTVPAARLVFAQLMQAQNLWSAGSVSSNGELGPESFSFTPRPMDKTIRSIIRPSSGVPDVF